MFLSAKEAYINFDVDLVPHLQAGVKIKLCYSILLVNGVSLFNQNAAQMFDSSEIIFYSELLLNEELVSFFHQKQIPDAQF